MWVKTTCCCHLYLLLIIRKLCLQFCIGADLYQYASFYLQKAATFSRVPATTGRELQPPSSCTSWYVCWYVGANLQKATTFSLPLGTTFHKFSNWIHQQHHNCNSIIKYICINQPPFETPTTESINHFDNPSIWSFIILSPEYSNQNPS